MADGIEFDTKRFDTQLDRFAKELGRDLLDVVNLTGLDMFSEITTLTPWDTGRARASWNLAYDSPNENVPPSGQADYKVATPPPMPAKFEVLFITSSLVYILPLENGHSKKAADGMVAITLAKWQRFLEEQWDTKQKK